MSKALNNNSWNINSSKALNIIKGSARKLNTYTFPYKKHVYVTATALTLTTVKQHWTASTEPHRLSRGARIFIYCFCVFIIFLILSSERCAQPSFQWHKYSFNNSKYNLKWRFKNIFETPKIEKGLQKKKGKS